MKKILASRAYFIKLGESGKWAEDCIKKSILKLGFRNPYHEECLKGKWSVIRQYWLKQGKTEGKATEITNMIKAFYESKDDVLWITFHYRKLYWCFSKKIIKKIDDGYRFRPAINGWSSKDTNGEELTVERLSSKLTKTQAFRGTICSVESIDYLIKRINGESLPEVINATKNYESFKKSLIPLIQNLTWQDFELFVDLIFTRAGYKRLDTLGKTQKSIDLDLLYPVTNKRTYVQVKSSANLNEFRESHKDFISMKHYDELFFVVHTPSESLNEYSGKGKENIITSNKLAELAITSGLSDWLIKKSQ